MTIRDAIPRVFLEPKAVYSVRETIRLLGTTADDLREWIDRGEIEPVKDGIPWAELVSFGVDFWSQEVVEDALGTDLANAIPELLRLCDLEVRIPRLEVVALERVAARATGARSTRCSRGNFSTSSRPSRNGCARRFADSQQRSHGRRPSRLKTCAHRWTLAGRTSARRANRRASIVGGRSATVG